MNSPELDFVRGLAPEISKHSDSIEQARRVPSDIIEQLRQAGVFSMTLLEAHGGSERDIRQTMSVIEALSHADAAVGWCAMIYLTTATATYSLPSDWVGTVLGAASPCAIIAGSAQPNGRARRVAGGLEVSGRWSWGSGVHHCDYICGGALIEGEPTHSKPHILFFEPKQLTLYDNWNPSGLKGTGSVDFSADRAFVPEGRWTVLGGSPRHSARLLARLPYFGMFATCVACVPLGIARRAIDDFCELAMKRTPTGGKRALFESSVVQLDVGRAEALVASARHHLFGAIGQVWDKLGAGLKADIDDLRALRLAASQTAISCAEAVDIVYHAAGGAAPLPEYPLQRHFRDLHTATQHAMVGRQMLQRSAAARLLKLTPSEAGL